MLTLQRTAAGTGVRSARSRLAGTRTARLRSQVLRALTLRSRSLREVELFARVRTCAIILNVFYLLLHLHLRVLLETYAAGLLACQCRESRHRLCMTVCSMLK